MKAYGTWLVSHGLMRAGLSGAAKRGDLIAQLTVDPALRADPFAAYEQLRQRGEVSHGRLIAATVSHAGVNQVLRNEDFGTASGRGGLPGPARRLMERWEDPYSLGPIDPPSLLALDGADHIRLRKMVARAFTARSVQGLEGQVTAVAEKLLDELAGESSFDLVERYASQLPVAVIADLLGVPDSDRNQVLAWGNEAALLLDPGLTWAQFRGARRAITSMHHWFQAHIERLRRDPGDDLLSRLAVMDGGLEDYELRAVGLLVLGAGFETTVSLLSNAVVLLDRHPEQRKLLVAEPERWPNAVEEVFRFDSPVQLTFREAYADTQVAGTPIEAGQAMLVVLGAANRDPEVFEDAQAFHVERPNAHEHVALSAGPHFCLGASLARLEGTVGLRLLYERFPDLSVTGTPVRRGTRVLRGYEHVPVSTSARPARRSVPAPSVGR
ncbi:MAG TPA: cytochrome P450 [Nocardioidaceae bacterium]|nr:cytochrome P450 [Nocardioidaceae bacterium]